MAMTEVTIKKIEKDDKFHSLFIVEGDKTAKIDTFEMIPFAVEMHNNTFLFKIGSGNLKYDNTEAGVICELFIDLLDKKLFITK